MNLIEEAFSLLDQLKGVDERTDELLEEAMKRIQAEVDALIFESTEARKALAMATLRLGDFDLDNACEVCMRPCTGRWCRRCEHGGGLALTPYEVESGIQ